jgi:hypothetical protein
MECILSFQKWVIARWMPSGLNPVLASTDEFFVVEAKQTLRDTATGRQAYDSCACTVPAKMCAPSLVQGIE